jgi:glycosyltransferase involved in cell wall biosynthesis
MKKILFLAPSVTRSNLSRPLEFAKALSSDNEIIIAGPAEKDVPIYRTAKGYKVKIKRIEDKKVSNALKLCAENDVIVACDARFYSCLAGLISKIKGKKFIFDVGDDEVELIKFGKNILKLNRLLISKFNFFTRHFADTIIVASSVLQKRYGGIVLPAPTNEKEYKKIKKGHMRKRYGNNLIIYTGPIQRFKGIDVLVESFEEIKKEISDSKMIFAGSMRMSPLFAGEIKERAKKISKKIIFMGHIKNEKKLKQLMRSADCLVIPNSNNPIHRAQVPIKLMHYMAAGRPIVATAVGDVPKILKNGKLGTVVKADNPKKLAKAIIDVLKNKKQAEKKAKLALEEFSKKYSYTAVKDKLRKIYD